MEIKNYKILLLALFLVIASLSHRCALVNQKWIQSINPMKFEINLIDSNLRIDLLPEGILYNYFDSYGYLPINQFDKKQLKSLFKINEIIEKQINIGSFSSEKGSLEITNNNHLLIISRLNYTYPIIKNIGKTEDENTKKIRLLIQTIIPDSFLLANIKTSKGSFSINYIISYESKLKRFFLSDAGLLIRTKVSDIQYIPLNSLDSLLIKNVTKFINTNNFENLKTQKDTNDFIFTLNNNYNETFRIYNFQNNKSLFILDENKTDLTLLLFKSTLSNIIPKKYNNYYDL